MAFQPNRKEFVNAIIPAFTAYEKGLVGWLKGAVVPRSDTLQEPTVQYAGGERAVRAVKALRDARNDRIKPVVVTIKLMDLEYLQERYHPPESPWGLVFNASDAGGSRRAARIPKGAPYRISYEVAIYTVYESDLRFIMNTYLMRFAPNGGVAYLKANIYRTIHTGLYPMYLRGFSPQVTSETGDEERSVRATMLIEMEAYLPFPYTFVPTFRKYTQQIEVRQPGELPDDEEVIVVFDDEMDLNVLPGE